MKSIANESTVGVARRKVALVGGRRLGGEGQEFLDGMRERWERGTWLLLVPHPSTLAVQMSSVGRRLNVLLLEEARLCVAKRC